MAENLAIKYGGSQKTSAYDSLLSLFNGADIWSTDNKTFSRNYTSAEINKRYMCIYGGQNPKMGSAYDPGRVGGLTVDYLIRIFPSDVNVSIVIQIGTATSTTLSFGYGGGGSGITGARMVIPID